MTIKNLNDLYLEQLRDLYSASKQAMVIVTDMGRAAKSSQLSEALISGNRGIADGMEMLAAICDGHEVDPTGEHCRGMEGLVIEARRHALETRYADDDAQDAAIITQYQRMAHYAIAGYGCVRTFADRLAYSDDAVKLQDCLDKSWATDRRMTQIAEGGVNKAALDGV